MTIEEAAAHDLFIKARDDIFSIVEALLSNDAPHIAYIALLHNLASLIAGSASAHEDLVQSHTHLDSLFKVYYKDLYGSRIIH